MKITGVIIIAVAIIFLGVFDSFRYKNTTTLINEILKLILLFKNDIIYRNSPFSELYQLGQKEKYIYLKFENNSVFLPDWADKKIKELFVSFINKIGTTDDEGQKSICDSYYREFLELYDKHKAKEKSKLQINLSLSLLSALSIVIIFI